jgi:membrane protease YdiL (CAAX protease family)
MQEEGKPQHSTEPTGDVPTEPCPALSGAGPGRVRRLDTFIRTPWSLQLCCAGLVVLAAFKGVFLVLGRMEGRAGLLTVSMLLWPAMFFFMAVLPLAVTWRERMLHWPRVGRVALEFIVAVPLLIGVLVAEMALIAVLTHLLGATTEFGAALAPLRNAPNEPRLYLLLVPMFTLGPLAEELFFRGFLYNALQRWMAPLLAVAIQAAVFALIHYQSPYAEVRDLVVVFFLGIVLVGIYEWRRTLWAPIALHSLHNLLFAGPILVLMILNSHTAARTWEQAEQPPAWMSTTLVPIEKQANGEAQRLHAIERWGSKGLHLWKQEIRAMEAVCAWFPNDRQACAQARDGIAMIYRVYLRDPRRAIVQANRVLSTYPDQPESCANAALTKADAYRDLGDYAGSRDAFNEVLRVYSAIDWARIAAEEGLKELEGGEY